MSLKKIMVCPDNSMNSLQRGFAKDFFFGSTLNFILHKVKAPVTIVKGW